MQVYDWIGGKQRYLLHVLFRQILSLKTKGCLKQVGSQSVAVKLRPEAEPVRLSQIDIYADFQCIWA